MKAVRTAISEDKAYRPSSPEKPERRFFVENDWYRWEVYVSRYEIRETGTPVYHAAVDEGHSAYGMTANEAVNDIAEIMKLKLSDARIKKVSLKDVRHYLEPESVTREEMKMAEALSRKPFLLKLLGFGF